MLGHLFGSAVIGLWVGVAIYVVYGMDRFRTTLRPNRKTHAVIVGVAVALVGFLLRRLGWL